MKKNKILLILIAIIISVFIYYVIPFLVVSTAVLITFKEANDPNRKPSEDEIKINDDYTLDLRDYRYLRSDSRRAIHGDISKYAVIHNSKLLVGYLLEDGIPHKLSRKDGYSGYIIIDDSTIEGLTRAEFLKQMKDNFNIDASSLIQGKKSQFKILSNGVVIAFLKNDTDVLKLTEKRGYFIFNMEKKILLAGLSKKKFIEILKDKYNIDYFPELKNVEKHRYY